MGKTPDSFKFKYSRQKRNIESLVINDKMFRDVFEEVLKFHCQHFCVLEIDIKTAIYALHLAYSKEGQNQGATKMPVDYDRAAYRCAYLHKYAAFHAALVQHIFLKYCLNTAFVKSLLLREEVIQICCLGGGPGSEVLGISSALSSVYHSENLHVNFTVVDCMRRWKSIFESVLEMAASGYGSLSSYLANRVTGAYMCSDLLHAGRETTQTIYEADIITMVKFVSAVNPERIFAMLKEVFTWMKPGAVVLFIDTTCGGFHEKVCQAAYFCGLEAECQPQKHKRYSSQDLKKFKFGFYSLSSASVSVQMWKKPAHSVMHIPSCQSFRHTAASDGTYEATSSSEEQDTEGQTFSIFESASMSPKRHAQLFLGESDSAISKFAGRRQIKFTFEESDSVTSKSTLTEFDSPSSKPTKNIQTELPYNDYVSPASKSIKSRQAALPLRDSDSPLSPDMLVTTFLTRTTSFNSPSYIVEGETNEFSSGDSISVKIRNVVIRQIYERLKSENFSKSLTAFSFDRPLLRVGTNDIGNYSNNVSQLLLEKKGGTSFPAQSQDFHNSPRYFTSAEMRRIVMPQISEMLKNKEKPL